MAAEDLLLRLAATIPASIGAWMTALVFLWMVRAKDATLRAGLWTWAVVSPLAVLAGLSAGGVLHFGVVVPADWPPFSAAWTAPAVLVAWAAVAAALLARRISRDVRLLACLEGVAVTAPVPSDLAAAVTRAANWMGVRAPRIAAFEGDGAAFVAGIVSPVLCVPLGLWRRLDAPGRRALILHELAHVVRRDPLRMRVAAVVADALWPALPLRWSAARLSDAWESQADERSVQDGATRSALARSLVIASAPAPRGVLAFGGGEGATVRRLSALRGRPRATTLAVQALVLALCIPWCPGWNDWGVSCRLQQRDEVRAGVVGFGFGSGGNPLTTVVGGEPTADRR